MKKTISFVLFAIMLFSLSACSSGQASQPSAEPPSEALSSDQQSDPILESDNSEATAPDSSSAENTEESIADGTKILVAYFSSDGNIATDEEAKGNVGKGFTKKIAELILKQVDGDMFFIETVNKYPANYNDTIDVAMQELRGNVRPELASHVESFEDYDIIFIGYPNWWGTVPQAILSFTDEYDFSGKTVIPFCTYQDSGIGRSIQDLEKALPNSTILESFSVRQAAVNDAEESINQWLSELNLRA